MMTETNPSSPPDPAIRSILKVFFAVALLGALPGLYGLFMATILALMAPHVGIWVLLFAVYGFYQLFAYGKALKERSNGSRRLWIGTAIYNLVLLAVAMFLGAEWLGGSAYVANDFEAMMAGSAWIGTMLWFGGLTGLGSFAARRRTTLSYR